MSKTLVLYNEYESQPRFFELHGDYSRWNGVEINMYGNDPELESEVVGFLYPPDGTGRENPDVVWLDAPTKDWDHFAYIGFLP